MAFVTLLNKIVCRFRGENSKNIFFFNQNTLGPSQTYPKLGGGERDRSRRSLSRSFFEGFGCFGLLHIGVKTGRFGDNEYDLDRDLDRARGDFERLLLLVRDLQFDRMKTFSNNFKIIFR